MHQYRHKDGVACGRHRRLSKTAIAWLLLMCQCHDGLYLAPIDVCERGAAVEREINLLRDGPQRVMSPGAVTALPNGGSLVVFSSSLYGTGNDQKVVRGAVLDRDGVHPTCDEPSEITYTDQQPNDKVDNILASVVGPSAPADPGLVVFARYQRDVPTLQVWGQFITEAGCRLGSTQPFMISAEPTGFDCASCDSCTIGDQPEINCVSTPAVAALSSQDFAVFWVSSHVSATTSSFVLKARVVRADYLGPQFLPTILNTDGAPARLTPVGQLPGTVAAVNVGSGRVAVSWQENSQGFRTLLRLYDDRLGALSDVIELHRGQTAPSAWGVALVRNGERLLATWAEGDDGGRVWARILLLDGTVPADAPASAFRISQGDCGVETGVAGAAMIGTRGAFLVAWHGAACSPPSTSQLRAVALTEQGKVLFSNKVCKAQDFRLTDSLKGDQDNVSLASLADGTIGVAWTDHGLNGYDQSISAVRGMVLRNYDLLPVEGAP